MRNPQRALLSIAALGVLLTGCSGGSSKPQVLPTLTATPSATPAAVEIPAAAKARTPQGAEAFVRYFFGQLNVAFSNADSHPIKALSLDACKTCSTYIASVDFANAKNLAIRGDSFAIEELAAAPLASTGTQVDVLGNIPDRTQVTSAGDEVQNLPSDGRFHVSVSVKWLADHWAVSDIASEK